MISSFRFLVSAILQTCVRVEHVKFVSGATEHRLRLVCMCCGSGVSCDQTPGSKMRICRKSCRTCTVTCGTNSHCSWTTCGNMCASLCLKMNRKVPNSCEVCFFVVYVRLFWVCFEQIDVFLYENPLRVCACVRSFLNAFRSSHCCVMLRVLVFGARVRTFVCNP